MLIMTWHSIVLGLLHLRYLHRCRVTSVTESHSDWQLSVTTAVNHRLIGSCQSQTNWQLSTDWQLSITNWLTVAAAANDDVLAVWLMSRSSLASYRLPSPAFPTSPYPSLAASPLSPFGPSSSLIGPSSSSSSPVMRSQQQRASPATTPRSASLFSSVSGLVDSPRYVMRCLGSLSVPRSTSVFSSVSAVRYCAA